MLEEYIPELAVKLLLEYSHIFSDVQNRNGSNYYKPPSRLPYGFRKT